MPESKWIIMPFRNNWEMTNQAIDDCLAMDPAVKVLVIGNSLSEEDREALEAKAVSARVLAWIHTPPIPSLAECWNTGLDFVWACGERLAMVVNNDIRVAPWTWKALEKSIRDNAALLVSAVGSTENQYWDFWNSGQGVDWESNWESRGGPDFSCYMISQECHQRFRFDPAFRPAYCEDLDVHRRIMLAGEGQRIYSINMPFLHYSSQTIKALDEKTLASFHKAVAEGARAYYQAKWGGPANEETFLMPFNPVALVHPCGHVTTPDLQFHCAYTRGEAVCSLEDAAPADSASQPTPPPQPETC